MLVSELLSLLSEADPNYKIFIGDSSDVENFVELENTLTISNAISDRENYSYSKGVYLF